MGKENKNKKKHGFFTTFPTICRAKHPWVKPNLRYIKPKTQPKIPKTQNPTPNVGTTKHYPSARTDR